MTVTTQTPALQLYRKQILGWMASHVSPASFAKEPDKELHRLLREYGVSPKKRGGPDIAKDSSHPYIHVDMAQCISCFRCVHVCAEVQGQFVWHAVERGADTHVVPDSGTTLGSSSCVACGACVDTCPTGALTDRDKGGGAAIEGWTRTTCVYCGVGCELEVGKTDGKVTRVRPCNDSPVSKGHLCVKGRYAFSFAHASDRQGYPLLRAGRKWSRRTWDETLDHCAQELSRISNTYGPDSIGVLGSARATNEENYLIQKFARVVLGTNNVDSCARVCHTPTAAAMKAMLGTGAATNSFDDIERANTFLVFGSNPLENHPVIGARIRQQVLRGGANLVVVDPRKTELARLAKVHLAIRPGTNIPLLNGLAYVVVTECLTDQTFIQERVEGLDAFKTFIAQWSAERAAAICGVTAEDIREAAHLYANAKPSMCFHGLGLTEHTQGTEGVMALVNLALLTGNIGKAGSGVNPLRGQNNVQGAAHMGCDPAILTGSVSLDERRALFEEAWHTQIPRGRGLDLLAMMDAAAAGRLKALWVTGFDILPTLANLRVTQRALANLEFVVVQDLFLTKTAQAVANVFLPAASVFEKDGTFMNSERRIQRVRKAVPPPGEAWPDWKITAELATRMGHGAQFSYRCAEDIWEEIRRVWPEGAGITYQRLEHGGLQWPCRTTDDPGTQVLHVNEFSRSRRAVLQQIAYKPTPERTSERYPLLLSTGRNLYQFNAGTMTMRTANVKLRPTDTLDIGFVDAERLGIANESSVRVQSRYGEATMTAHVTEAMKPGEVFATFHDPRVRLNNVTSSLRDNLVHTPEYKVTAVRVEPC